MKLSPQKAFLFGIVLAIGCVMLTAAGLTTWVGNFVGNGAGLTNVPASSTVSGVTITNGVFQWQLDATFEDVMTKHDTHGIDLDYRKIDLSFAQALFRTVDGAFHFTTPPYIDGVSYQGNALGVDANGLVVPNSALAPVNNYFITNLFAITNNVDYFNSYSNSFITFLSTTVFNQNISVKGNATLNTIIITNNTLFSTNAFPLSPGTVWDWSKHDQFLSTNADFNITAITGLSNNLENLAELEISNAGASQIIGHLQFAMTKYGDKTTNDLYIPSHGQALVAGKARGIGTTTNIVTLPQQ